MPLNHRGSLCRGNLLKWVEAAAWIAATRERPGCKFVTIGPDRVEFRESVREGTILHFQIELARRARSSVQYQVVYGDDPDTGSEASIFTTRGSLACLDA